MRRITAWRIVKRKRARAAFTGEGARLYEGRWNSAGVAIVSSSDRTVLDALLATPPRYLIDLTGRLGSEVEALPGYEGLGW